MNKTHWLAGIFQRKINPVWGLLGGAAVGFFIARKIYLVTAGLIVFMYMMGTFDEWLGWYQEYMDRDQVYEIEEYKPKQQESDNGYRDKKLGYDHEHRMAKLQAEIEILRIEKEGVENKARAKVAAKNIWNVVMDRNYPTGIEYINEECGSFSGLVRCHFMYHPIGWGENYVAEVECPLVPDVSGNRSCTIDPTATTFNY